MHWRQPGQLTQEVCLAPEAGRKGQTLLFLTANSLHMTQFCPGGTDKPRRVEDAFQLQGLSSELQTKLHIQASSSQRAAQRILLPSKPIGW